MNDCEGDREPTGRVVLLGSGVRALLIHLEQLERLRTDLSAIPDAVEESLRFEGPTVSARLKLLDLRRSPNPPIAFGA